MYADELIKQNQLEEAALIYFNCNRNFEETCLKFMVVKRNNGLESIHRIL